MLPRDTREMKMAVAKPAAKKSKVASAVGGGRPAVTKSASSTPRPRDAQSQDGSATSESKVAKSRGKGARIPIEPDALLRYEGFDDIKTWFASAMLTLQEPPFTVLCPSPADSKHIDAKSREFVEALTKQHKALITIDGKMMKRQSTPAEALDILRDLKNVLKRVSCVFYDSGKRDLDASKMQGHLEFIARGGFVMAPVIVAKVTRVACIDAIVFGNWEELKKLVTKFTDDHKAVPEESLQKYVDGVFDLGLTKLMAGFAGTLS